MTTQIHAARRISDEAEMLFYQCAYETNSVIDVDGLPMRIVELTLHDDGELFVIAEIIEYMR